LPYKRKAAELSKGAVTGILEKEWYLSSNAALKVT